MLKPLGRRARRRRPHPRRDPRLGHQQRRLAQGRLPRPERRRPGARWSPRRWRSPASTPRRIRTSRPTARARHRRPDRDRRRSPQAFRRTPTTTQFCAIGSLKTNIGHIGEAAGVAALIKTVLALQHREIPPSLHYETPNPQVDFAEQPVLRQRRAAPVEARPAGGGSPGVTALGAGGTNAHVVVEEAPAPAPAPTPARATQLITAVGARRRPRSTRGADAGRSTCAPTRR